MNELEKVEGNLGERGIWRREHEMDTTTREYP